MQILGITTIVCQVSRFSDLHDLLAGLWSSEVATGSIVFLNHVVEKRRIPSLVSATLRLRLSHPHIDCKSFTKGLP